MSSQLKTHILRASQQWVELSIQIYPLCGGFGNVRIPLLLVFALPTLPSEDILLMPWLVLYVLRESRSTVVIEKLSRYPDI